MFFSFCWREKENIILNSKTELVESPLIHTDIDEVMLDASLHALFRGI